MLQELAIALQKWNVEPESGQFREAFPHPTVNFWRFHTPFQRVGAFSQVATVCVACFMRYLAHCFFNDRDQVGPRVFEEGHGAQARREDQMMRRKNKASSTAPGPSKSD